MESQNNLIGSRRVPESMDVPGSRRLYKVLVGLVWSWRLRSKRVWEGPGGFGGSWYTSRDWEGLGGFMIV